jgi:hypothetical protein
MAPCPSSVGAKITPLVDNLYSNGSILTIGSDIIGLITDPAILPDPAKFRALVLQFWFFFKKFA